MWEVHLEQRDGVRYWLNLEVTVRLTDIFDSPEWRPGAKDDTLGTT
jgi:hypothetical protein